MGKGNKTNLQKIITILKNKFGSSMEIIILLTQLIEKV